MRYLVLSMVCCSSIGCKATDTSLSSMRLSVTSPVAFEMTFPEHAAQAFVDRSLPERWIYITQIDDADERSPVRLSATLFLGGNDMRVSGLFFRIPEYNECEKWDGVATLSETLPMWRASINATCRTGLGYALVATIDGK